MDWKRDVKKREKSRLFPGLEPKHCGNGEVIYTGGEHLGKSCFHDKNPEFCFRCIKFELPILQPNVWVWSHLIESEALRSKNK